MSDIRESRASCEMSSADGPTHLLLDHTTDGLARLEVGAEVLILPLAKGGD